MRRKAPPRDHTDPQLEAYRGWLRIAEIGGEDTSPAAGRFRVLIAELESDAMSMDEGQMA
jgi:hypothetical protein